MIKLNDNNSSRVGYGNTLYYTSEIGPTGNDGADGNGIVSATNNGDGTFTLTFDDGTTFTTDDLTGPQGIAGNDGADGDSAYDIWLSLGNTGTQQDFIDSLTGPQGDTTSSVSTYNINTYYAELGGYVIDVNDDGTSGVVVAMQNQSEYTNWWDAFNLANDPTLHDNAGKKFRDWRLPTKRELELMWQVYENGNEPNLWGHGNSGWLWSSSEHWDNEQNITKAWSHTFLQGGITAFKPKTFLYALRAVRSFSSSSNN
jgi:hypothetical protein